MIVSIKNFNLQNIVQFLCSPKISWHGNVYRPIHPKCASFLSFLEKQTLSQKQWQHSIHQGNGRLKAYENVRFCVWFLIAQSLLAERTKFCIYDLFFFFNFDSFQNNRLNFFHQGLSQKFCFCRASFLENVSHVGKFTDRSRRKLQKFSISAESNPFSKTTGCISFINLFFYTRKKLLDC